MAEGLQIGGAPWIPACFDPLDVVDLSRSCRPTERQAHGTEGLTCELCRLDVVTPLARVIEPPAHSSAADDLRLQSSSRICFELAAMDTSDDRLALKRLLCLGIYPGDAYLRAIKAADDERIAILQHALDRLACEELRDVHDC